MAEGTITFEEARDLVCGRFKEQLDDDYASILVGMGVDPAEPTVYWDNLSSDGQPPKDAAWFRVQIQHLAGSQHTLGGVGGRRFNRIGLVTVQIFVPAGTRGLTLADRLGKMAVDAFEGKDADGVWFRDVSLSEIGNDSAWYQTNVRAEFTYDQTK